jgi:hypothetical protein
MDSRLLGSADKMVMINTIRRCRLKYGAEVPLPSANGFQMRTSPLIGLWVLFTLGAASVWAASPANRATPERISQLISQLGSNDFKEREGAAAALNAIGEPALAALKKAMQDRDPEVRRRAESLANVIHKRAEIDQILQPRQVHLQFKNIPLTEAVAEFAKMTGFNIELNDSPAESISWFLGRKTDFGSDLAEPTLRTLNPRITLDTGETSFWQAVDQFCQAYGLVERTGVLPSDLTANLWNAQPAAGQRLMATIPNLPFNAIDGLVLEGGDPTAFPTCYAGSVRIRAKPGNSVAGISQNPKGESGFVLEVAPQPKMGWQSIVDFHVESALDEQGHSLSVSLGRDGQEVLGMNRNGLQINGAFIWDVNGHPRLFDGRSIPVRLKLANKRSKRLKEFRGTVSAQVLTPPRPLVAVENVLKSAGQSHEGRSGESLKIIAVSQLAKGRIKIRYRLEDPFSGWMLNNRLMMPGNVILRRNNVVFPGPVVSETEQARGGSLALYDANGGSFQMDERKLEKMPDMERGISEWTVTYGPPNSRSQAEKLVYSGRRLVIIDIPFTLKDVPLK